MIDIFVRFDIEGRKEAAWKACFGYTRTVMERVLCKSELFRVHRDRFVPPSSDLLSINPSIYTFQWQLASPPSALVPFFFLHMAERTFFVQDGRW